MRTMVSFERHLDNPECVNNIVSSCSQQHSREDGNSVVPLKCLPEPGMPC